jgi:hypothetical protein
MADAALVKRTYKWTDVYKQRATNCFERINYIKSKIPDKSSGWIANGTVQATDI